MKIAIMQPYLLPYFGYFQLINSVDKFVIYDNVNYIKKGWIDKNFIPSKTNNVKIGISIQKASQNKKINELFLAQDRKNILKTLKTIETIYSKSENFNLIYPVIQKIFNSPESSLPIFILNSLKVISSILGIKTEFIIASNIENLSPELSGQNKIIDICNKMNATTYINAIGGQDLYNYTAFENEKLKLNFIQSTCDKNLLQYSILDKLMTIDLNKLKEEINNYELITKQ